MVSGFNRILVTLVVAWSGMAIAGQIDRVVVVGADSLSDTGNLSLLSGGTQPPSTAYEPGTFSNGPIWIDELAADLGLTMNDTALITGPLGNGFVDNFAVAGSLTHSYNLGPSINVSNVADTVAACDEAGHQILMKAVELRPGVSIGMVADPDGNVVEFIQYG